jgi:hypothetical protein
MEVFHFLIPIIFDQHLEKQVVVVVLEKLVLNFALLLGFDPCV